MAQQPNWGLCSLTVEVSYRQTDTPTHTTHIRTHSHNTHSRTPHTLKHKLTQHTDHTLSNTNSHNTHTHTHTHTQDSPEPVISSSHMPLPTQHTNISMYFAGLEPAIPAIQRLHSAYLRADRTATSITIDTATERC